VNYVDVVVAVLFNFCFVQLLLCVGQGARAQAVKQSYMFSVK